MKPLTVKRPRTGFYLTAAALVTAVIAFITYLLTFDAFHYATDRWVTALMIIAIWTLACLIVCGLLFGDEPFYIDILRVAAVFCMTVATLKFLLPCLSPIGIYFTVHNMGDVEANAIGVPRSIVCVVFCVISVVLMMVSAFFTAAKQPAATVEPSEPVEPKEEVAQ